MSEMKCPCCGGELVMDEEGDALHCCGCLFACEPKYIHRIAAAMKAEARHNALVEAVAWEREFDEVLVWLVQTGRYPTDMTGRYDLANERECARAEVDRLLNEGADCKGEG